MIFPEQYFRPHLFPCLGLMPRLVWGRARAPTDSNSGAPESLQWVAVAVRTSAAARRRGPRVQTGQGNRCGRKYILGILFGLSQVSRSCGSWLGFLCIVFHFPSSLRHNNQVYERTLSPVGHSRCQGYTKSSDLHRRLEASAEKRESVLHPKDFLPSGAG